MKTTVRYVYVFPDACTPFMRVGGPAVKTNQFTMRLFIAVHYLLAMVWFTFDALSLVIVRWTFDVNPLWSIGVLTFYLLFRKLLWLTFKPVSN